MPSNHLILCCPLFLLSIFPSIRVFLNELALCIRWPKYWSFSISLSKECSGLIAFMIDRFHFLAVQGTLKSPPAQFENINSSALSLLYGPTLTLYSQHLSCREWCKIQSIMKIMLLGGNTQGETCNFWENMPIWKNNHWIQTLFSMETYTV